jgi:hypothetical protein
MSLEELALYLTLAPEFGGTRFGPFEGLEVRLGSDGDRCHIVLPPALGVLPEHGRVIRQGPGNLILAPAERTAALFLWKKGARRPDQLATPTAVRPGDSFSLVTPDGPRFIVELDELPPEMKEARAKAKSRSGVGRSRLSAESMGAEVKRQAFTQLLVTKPAQLLQRAVVFVKSGAIYQPRNIIMGLTLLGGMVLGGVGACKYKQKSAQVVTITREYEECRDQAGFLAERGSRDFREWDIAALAYSITGSQALGTALDQDRAFADLVMKRSRSILADPAAYDWLWNPSDGRAAKFADWRERVLETDDLDNDTRNLLIWLAARRRKGRTPWETFGDTEGDDVCGHGPLRMTYRQALHLGMQVRPDAYYRGSFEKLAEDRQKREELLQTTVELAGTTLPEEGFESDFLRADSQASIGCVFVVESDERTNIGRTLRAFRNHLGDGAEGLPPSSDNQAALARIARYWAADAVTEDYERGEFRFQFQGSAVLSTALEPLEKRGQWVAEKTADTVAQALVVPCIGRLNYKPEEIEHALGPEEEQPDPVECLILNWKLQNEQ